MTNTCWPHFTALGSESKIIITAQSESRAASRGHLAAKMFFFSLPFFPPFPAAAAAVGRVACFAVLCLALTVSLQGFLSDRAPRPPTGGFVLLRMTLAPPSSSPPTPPLSAPHLPPLQPDVSVLLPLDDPAVHQPLSANMGLSMRGLEIFY